MLITKAELELAKLAAKDESRYGKALQCVAVDKEQSVVTTGHYLIAVKHGTFSEQDYPVTEGLEHAAPNGKPILIHRDTALNAAKALPKKNTIPVLGCAALGKDGKLFVNDLERVQSFAGQVTETFPNWQAVMPKPDEKVAVKFAVNADYLSALCDYISKQHGSDNYHAPVVTITVYAADKAIKLEATTKDGQEIVQLLMPVRM